METGYLLNVCMHAPLIFGSVAKGIENLSPCLTF